VVFDARKSVGDGYGTALAYAVDFVEVLDGCGEYALERSVALDDPRDHGAGKHRDSAKDAQAARA
jgi:hypothetical protein